MTDDSQEAAQVAPHAGSVVDRVLLSFVDAVEADEEVKDLAGRLRETLVVKHNLSEAALRAALFESDVP